MASPPEGLDPQQTQDWATKFQADMRRRGQNPVSVGFDGTQTERDSYAQFASSRQPQPNTPVPTGNSLNMSAWSGGGRPSNNTQSFTLPGTRTQGGQQWFDMSNYGNMANMPRPEVDFGQQVQQGMAQLAMANNQRAAALAQVLDQGKLYQLAGATNQNIGQPQYDPMAMMQNANSMVNAGWQNPFANIAGFGVQPPAPPSNPVADLFQRNGIQTPPGFMDQLLGLLGQQSPPQQFGPPVGLGPQGPQPLTGGGYEAPQTVGGPDPYPTTQLRDGGNQYRQWAMRNPNDPRATPILEDMRQREAARRERLAQQGTPVGQDGLTDSERQRQSEFRERMEAKRPDSVSPFEGMDRNGNIRLPDGRSVHIESAEGRIELGRRDSEARDRIPSTVRPKQPAPQAREFPLIADDDGVDFRDPQAQRYVPVPPGSTNGVFDPTAQIVNANRFISDLERTNPNTWTDQQWGDYEAASRDSLLADRGGYYRRDGQVYRSFGNAIGPDGNVRRGEPVAPAQPPAPKPVPVADPGTAKPIPPKEYGTPYYTPTPPRVQPTPPPRRVLTDADVAAQKAEERRIKASNWAAANPNNWFMNPYMQDNPTVQAARRRGAPANKSGKGGGGSSPSKQINFKGPPTAKRR